MTHLAHHGEAAKSHLGLIRLRHGADPDACSRERSGKGRGSFRYFATGVGRGRRRASKRRQKPGRILKYPPRGGGYARREARFVHLPDDSTHQEGVPGSDSGDGRTGTDDGLGGPCVSALESAEGVTGDGWHSGEGADCGHGDCAWRGFLSFRREPPFCLTREMRGEASVAHEP